MSSPIKYTFILIVLLSLIILFPSTIQNLNWGYWNHFTQQSDSFLDGRFDISGGMDTVEINGKYYWHQSPFPSIILLPFKLFWRSFDQFHMQILLVATLVILLYKLTRTQKYSPLDCLLLTIVFLCGSPILGLILNPSTWYYAQLVTVVLLIALILEMETKQRPLVMGFLLAFITATRPTAALISLPILYIIIKQSSKEKLFRNLLIFLFPIIIAVLILMWFNYVRFHHIFYNSYLTNVVGGPMSYFRSLGLLNIQHIPTNLYYYFLTSVNPVTDNSGAHLVFPYITYSAWGISLFLIAPFFLYAFRTIFSKEKVVKFFWIVIILNLFFLMVFFAPGWVQFGPRYTADFMPILFLLTLKGLNSKSLTLKQQIIIILSSLFNIYLYATPFLIN